MRVLRSLLVLATLATAATAGCGGDHDHDESSSAQADTTCGRDGRKDVYVAGLAKTGGALTVKVTDALPAPPEKGKNALTLQLTDAAGAPVEGAQIVVTPFMPDHGHGSAAPPAVSAEGAGRYTVSNLVLTMPGLWEVRMSIQAAGATSDVTFAFCVDG